MSSRTDGSDDFDVVEASIADLRSALDDGRVTSVGLVTAYLRRVAAYDRAGITLNAVPVLDPSAFDAARAADERRAAGTVLSRLDGIPYTAKDSYSVQGMVVAAGSPALVDFVAREDAFVIERLRAAGAVFLGLTNMPPMANGGMQRGLYGRAESPYDRAWLTSAYASGSSNGSGTATSASFAAFGLGEETWSSGRAPASNNALVAYTPSRGVISVRGNWPLVPTMDVVVPHTRTVADLLEVLDVIVADDDRTTGDLWRSQPWVSLPRPSEVRPDSYRALEPLPLAGLRIGVPRMFVNAEPGQANPIDTRPSVLRLLDALRADLEARGATVVEVAFPALERDEKATPDALTPVERGIVPERFAEEELWDLSMAWLDGFLAANGQPGLSGLADLDRDALAPLAPGTLPDRFGEYDFELGEYVDRARRDGIADWRSIATLADGLRGLEETRRVDHDDWLDEEGLDVLLFPTVADVAPADAEVNPESFEIAWRNGVWVANGNLVPRRLGIPTVTVPMGLLDDIGMPVGATIAGRGHDDTTLLRIALALEAVRDRRVPPRRTPALGAGPDQHTARPAPTVDRASVVRLEGVTLDGCDLTFRGRVDGAVAPVAVWVDGAPTPPPVVREDGSFVGTVRVDDPVRSPHTVWRAPYAPLVIAVASDATGPVSGAVATTDGAPI